MTPAGPAGRALLLLAGLALFVAAATLNSAGYRFGASDQAFYEPAVVHALHPGLYPRDTPVIEAQARLTGADQAVAWLIRLTGLSLPVCFALLYASTLVTLALAARALGRLYFREGFSTIALIAGLSMRHAIAMSGTNTLEGYFHPRQVAFALGAWAVVLFLRARGGLSCIAVAAAAFVHPTTALWFAVWLVSAAVVADPRRLRLAAPLAVAGAAAALWALTVGPLAGRLQLMDPEWLATLATKPYLFPLAWPWHVWVTNLAYAGLIIQGYRLRRASRLVTARETGLAVGSLVLLGLFLASLPLNAARVQLAIQLQPARVFWMLDFLATIYVVWWLAEAGGATRGRARAVALVVCALSLTRGLYVAFVAFPDRPMFAIHLPDSDWIRVMTWARQTPADSHWLAHPDHALLYGTSVRVAAERDVFVEASKDLALGMYERSIAMRTRDRLAEVGVFWQMPADRVRMLAAKYGLDFMVTDARLDLPVAFTSGRLTVYRLR
jgi:hypothetical protein